MSGVALEKDELVMVPDRWAQSGWKWRQKHLPQPYFQQRTIATSKGPAAATTVDPTHMGLMPHKWSPTGWRYVSADFQPRRHPNIRNFDRRTVRREACSSSFTTTSMAFYQDPSPVPSPPRQVRQIRRPQISFPPLPMDIPLAQTHRKQLSLQLSPQTDRTQTLGGLLDSEPVKETLGWAGETINRKSDSFRKRRHLESEWTELLLSGGLIR